MIKQFVKASGEYLLGEILTDWVRAKQIIKRVSKWRHLNYYVAIEDLSRDEALVLEAYLSKKKVGDCGKNGYECMVRVYGPRLLTTRPNKFFIVQVSPNGEPNVSIPLTEEQARRTLHSARGVKSYLCTVIDSVDSSAKSNASSIYPTQLV